MSKYTAVFSVGWMTVHAEGDTLEYLVREIEKKQDLQCLVQMAGTMGTKKDKKEIEKLIDFLKKYMDDSLTVDDVRKLDVKLSVGAIKCKSLSEQE